MKTLKKSVALFLSLLMLMSMLTVAASVTAFAADQATVTIKSKQDIFNDITKTVKAGDEITTTLKLQSDNLFVNGEFYYEYDKDVFKITAQKRNFPLLQMDTNLERTTGAANFTDGSFGVDFTTETTLYSVTFKVLKTTGNLNITFDIATLIGSKNDPSLKSDDIVYVNVSKVQQKTGFKVTLDAEVKEGEVQEPDPTPSSSEPTTPSSAGGTKGDYYLVGYINKVDVDGNDYHFVNGQVSLTVTDETYVAVKDANGDWYMTHGFPGMDATSTTLYKTYYGEEGTDKFFIPTGKMTITIAENTDGSLTISYTKTGDAPVTPTSSSATNPSSSQQGGGTKGDYYLVGYINKVDVEGNDYHFVNGQISLTVTADTYVAVKDANGDWYMTHGFPGMEATETTLYKTYYGEEGTDKFFVPTGEMTITIAENADGTLTISYAKTGDAPVKPTSPSATNPSSSQQGGGTKGDYYLVGYINAKDYEGNDYHFVNGQISLTVTADTYVAVKDASGTWYMTHGFPGMTATSTTLYKTYYGEQGTDKFYVPTGEMTIYLTENADGTLTISYAKTGDAPEIPSSATTPSSAGGGTKGDYYLVGYINKVDVDGNDYHFVNGQVSLTVTDETYVAVKDANGDWYMTHGFPGMTATSTTLYKTYYGEEGTDKFFVPTGEMTIYLTENADGTLTISYAKKGDAPVTPSSATTPSSAGGTKGDYYLVGYINKVDVDGNDYHFVNGQLTLTVTDETYVAVKDANGDWYMTHGFPGMDATSTTLYKTYYGEEGTDKFHVPTGEMTIYLTENADGTLTISYAKKGDAPVTPTTPSQPSGGKTEYTFYFVPTAADVAAGCTFKLNAHVNGAADDDWTYPDFVATSEKYSDGRTIYAAKTTVPTNCDFDALQYQVYNGTEWVRQYVDKAAKVTDFADKIVVAGEGTSYTIDGSSGENPSSGGSTKGDYYLVGYINAEDVEGNDYHFVNGQISLTVTADTYVAVKDANGDWYMTHGFPGMTATSTTLYKTYYGEEGTDKFFVPTGEMTIYLTENADGTLTISYAKKGDAPVTPSSGSGTKGNYYLVGYINAEDVEGNDYAFVNGQLTLDVYADTYVAVKDANGDWYMTHGFPGMDATSTTLYKTYYGEEGTDKFFIPTGNVTIYLSENADGTLNISYSAGGSVTPSSGSGTKGDYYLVGYINAEDVEGNDYYFVNGQLTLTVTDETYVAVKDANGDWYMTHGFPGMDATSTTLYKTYYGEEGTDKFFIPTGEVTIYLSENADGTLNISYSTGSLGPAPIGDYYLVGYINAADVEGNDYAFVDGQLTLSVYDETYVAVKNAAGDWYMTHGFPGMDATSTTLYKTYYGEEGTDKFFIPTGEVTIYLTENADGTLQISYVVASDDDPTPPVTDPTPEPTPEPTPKPTEPETPAVTDPTPAVTDPTPAVTDPTESETPAVTDPTPAVTDPTPAVTDPTPAVTDPTPAVTDPTESETPAVTDPTPAVTDPTPAVTDPTESETPAVTDPTPAVTDPTPSATDPTESETPGTTEPSDDTTPTESEPADDTTPTESDSATEPTESETPGTTEPSETTPAPTQPSTPAPTQPSTPTPTKPTTPKPATQPTTVKPATDLGAGASGAAVEAAILAMKNDKDPKGSTFNLLQVKNTKTTKNSIKISYKKPSGAKKFVIYGAKCGKDYKVLKTVTAKSFTYKGLKKGTYYKFLVVALDGKGKVVATSKTIHVATNGGKFTNPGKVKITNASSAKSIKKGAKLTLKTKVTAASKKLTLKNHRKVKFESTKPSVVKVTAGGKITAKKKGTATIYAYAQNGVMAKIKIKVS